MVKVVPFFFRRAVYTCLLDASAGPLVCAPLALFAVTCCDQALISFSPSVHVCMHGVRLRIDFCCPIGGTRWFDRRNFAAIVIFLPSSLAPRGSQGAEGVVTLGETSVLAEFQLSNDLLRKRCVRVGVISGMLSIVWCSLKLKMPGGAPNRCLFFKH